jgi:hypothetical protein
VSDKTGQTMRAARWHNRRDVRIEEVPVPTPRADQVLVEVEWCGICGTDLEEYRDGPVNIPLEEHPLTRHKAPITLGHEIVGKVVEAARDGSGPPEGARVIPDVVCPPSLLQIRSHNAANWRSRWEPTLPPNQISFENFSRTLPQGSVPTSLSSARGFRVSQSRRYA